MRHDCLAPLLTILQLYRDGQFYKGVQPGNVGKIVVIALPLYSYKP
jgi:(2Fe-2S) ferredoxin